MSKGDLLRQAFPLKRGNRTQFTRRDSRLIYFIKWLFNQVGYEAHPSVDLADWIGDQGAVMNVF